MKTKKYVSGGPIVPDPRNKKTIVGDSTRQPIYTSNPNDPRLRAYQDSLSLYNRGKEKLEYWRENPNATNSELNRKEVEIEKKYPISQTRGAFGSDLIRAIDMQKIGKGSAERSVPLYKKPVQPVEYRASEKAVVKPKGPSLSVKKKELAPQKSLPKSITGVKMDASGANVYLSVNGKQTVMPKKEFTSWLKNSDNRAMYDKYRASLAKK